MAKEQIKSDGRQKKSVEKYLEEISLCNPIPSAEEVELTRRVRKGDSSALDKLVTANLRFVISIAKQYQGQGLPLEDLISEGNLGLIKAAGRFDETRGFKFISYAVWWIRQSILQALAEQTRMVRLPMHHVGSIHKVGKVFEKLHKKYDREPSLSEIADCLGMTAREVGDVLNMSVQHLSLDEPFKQGENSKLLDVLENEKNVATDSHVMKESLIEEINNILVRLKPREAEIIRFSFGLVGERPLTLDEIGKHFKLTRERIRQIKEKALRRMRHHTRSEPLRKYLG
jgi:RNA polymerase primary sigma factor